ncbi:methyltransferase [Naumannella cuiyingiana]|uniref:16S rRNA G1207 methylase RsmC n=1 Tax=Naumannella cuiyingiana TaxID=1347891 RepID=A0A7Z0IKE0_9ACTN|nr:16S rRNA G1207 methylase RsmC [Naumannella cuiyingiana]
MSGQYFETPTGPIRAREVTATIWDREFRFATANGVYSAAGLDPGTGVLLRESEPPGHGGHLVDLGCGWGPIAIGLAVCAPQITVDAVDVNRRALELCARNAEAAGVADRVRVLHADEVDPTTRYDELWSNPPIRIGKAALHDLLLEWLPRLESGGRARMVVGRNLGADSLQRWLVEQGYPTERVGSAKGFRILQTTAP